MHAQVGAHAVSGVVDVDSALTLRCAGAGVVLKGSSDRAGNSTASIRVGLTAKLEATGVTFDNVRIVTATDDCEDTVAELGGLLLPVQQTLRLLLISYQDCRMLS